MNKKYYDEYILADIKYNNYYYIYNSKDIHKNKLTKDLFNYKEIVNKTFKYDNYILALYKEQINILYECFLTS